MYIIGDEKTGNIRFGIYYPINNQRMRKVVIKSIQIVNKTDVQKDT